MTLAKTILWPSRLSPMHKWRGWSRETKKAQAQGEPPWKSPSAPLHLGGHRSGNRRSSSPRAGSRGSLPHQSWSRPSIQTWSKHRIFGIVLSEKMEIFNLPPPPPGAVQVGRAPRHRPTRRTHSPSVEDHRTRGNGSTGIALISSSLACSPNELAFPGLHRVLPTLLCRIWHCWFLFYLVLLGIFLCPNPPPDSLLDPLSPVIQLLQLLFWIVPDFAKFSFSCHSTTLASLNPTDFDKFLYSVLQPFQLRLLFILLCRQLLQLFPRFSSESSFFWLNWSPHRVKWARPPTRHREQHVRNCGNFNQTMKERNNRLEPVSWFFPRG